LIEHSRFLISLFHFFLGVETEFCPSITKVKKCRKPSTDPMKEIPIVRKHDLTTCTALGWTTPPSRPSLFEVTPYLHCWSLQDIPGKNWGEHSNTEENGLGGDKAQLNPPKSFTKAEAAEGETGSTAREAPTMRWDTTREALLGLLSRGTKSGEAAWTIGRRDTGAGEGGKLNGLEVGTRLGSTFKLLDPPLEEEDQTRDAPGTAGDEGYTHLWTIKALEPTLETS
jgi:hypothetical protein